MVVQLGGLLGGPADQPDIDVLVAAQEAVPATFRVDLDGVAAGAHLGGDVPGEGGEIAEGKRRGGVQQHGKLQ